MRSNLEMKSNHFTLESSNESDQRITISNFNPFFTDSFCFEKFGHFNEISSCVPAPLYSSLPLFYPEDSKSLGGRKGKMKNEEIRDGKMQKEVIHVRAKRGQATDTHSLAERARREKVNQRLKFLQELVPGCYKTMGMAVMLDVIINYIHSLHNQIEFLSMKLSVASRYYDFNDSSETDGMEMIQATNIGYDNIQEIEKIVVREEEEERYGGPFYQNSTFPPNF